MVSVCLSSYFGKCNIKLELILHDVVVGFKISFKTMLINPFVKVNCWWTCNLPDMQDILDGSLQIPLNKDMSKSCQICVLLAWIHLRQLSGAVVKAAGLLRCRSCCLNPGGKPKNFQNWFSSTETQQPLNCMRCKARGCLVLSVLSRGKYKTQDIP